MMNKRRFLRTLVGAAGMGASSLAAGSVAVKAGVGLAGLSESGTEPASAHESPGGGLSGRPLLLQSSPLAGFQYYAGEQLWSQMKPGDGLELRRAPKNPYDQRAVEVWWQGNMLGHLPRLDNAAVSQMLDRGVELHAMITAMQQSNSPWQRIKLEVWHA